jgi:hypothetical protein
LAAMNRSTVAPRLTAKASRGPSGIKRTGRQAR